MTPCYNGAIARISRLESDITEKLKIRQVDFETGGGL